VLPITGKVTYRGGGDLPGTDWPVMRDADTQVDVHPDDTEQAARREVGQVSDVLGPMSASYTPAMKAAVCTRYGLPEVVVISEVEKPATGDNGLLVKAHATKP
jgi:hypothetical protein